MANVLDQAQNFSGGPVAAARKRDSWALREANATDEETREQYREAIADLEARYPDIADVPIGGAEAFARERGHGTGARSPVHEGRRRPGSGKTSPATSPRKTPSPARSKTSSTSTSSGRQPSSGRPTPRLNRAIRQTGIPAATESGASATMMALGATVGLSLLYLLLSSAETPGTGGRALPQLINSVTGFLQRFIGLHDFFPSNRQAPWPGEPVYAEGPGSNVAKAAARLKGAERLRKRQRRRKHP